MEWRVLRRTETIEIGDRYSNGSKPIDAIGKLASESPYKVYRKVKPKTSHAYDSKSDSMKPRAKARKAVRPIKPVLAWACLSGRLILPHTVRATRLQIKGYAGGRKFIRVKIVPVK